MFIEIRELEQHTVTFQETFPPDAIDLGEDVRQRTPLVTSGQAQLVEEHHGKHQVIKDIRLAGNLATSLELPCARCLDPVVEDVARAFDLLYRPLGTDAGHEEISVTVAEAEIGYYQGDGLQLEDAIREQVLLSVPLKVLCRENCLGLCPVCGKNRNTEPCGCAQPIQDPRWSALKEIREKLDH
jgi:uncharacterized protein